MGTILLADDHEVVRSGIRNALCVEKPYPCVIQEVDNGVDLMYVIQNQTIDVLVLDLIMPQFEPMRDIPRIQRLSPHTKILIISAYDDLSYIKGLLEMGVNGYHPKDSQLSQLPSAVDHIQNGEIWLPPAIASKLTDFSAPSAESEITLTPRQMDMLAHLQQGHDNQRIAREIGISVKTVENHLTRLYRVLDVQSRLEAVQLATEHFPPIQQAVRSPSDANMNAISSTSTVFATKEHTIVVVDDNVGYGKRLSSAIEKIVPKATLHFVSTIQDAERLAMDFHVHLFLVDVVLGDEQGIECTRLVHQINPKSVILLMTAYPDREFHKEGLSAGAKALLDKKDINKQVLYHLIEDALQV